MIQFKVLTLFPDIINVYINSSAPIKRGIEKELIDVMAINFRDFSKNKHKKVDDVGYGGGPGMVLAPEPLEKCIEKYQNKNSRIYFLDPKGKPFCNEMAKKISTEEDVILICGRYEGFDQRIIDITGGELLSMGDFVLSGGELAALAVIDSSIRFIKGCLDNEGSSLVESFNTGLLEYDHYTRPSEYQGLKVPEVLMSGNHKKIEEWKIENSIKNTIKNRPELLKSLYLKDAEIEMLKKMIKELYGGHECR